MKRLDEDVMYYFIDPLTHFLLFDQDPTYSRDQKQRIMKHVEDFLVDQVIIRLHDRTKDCLYNAISDRIYLDFVNGVSDEKKT
ncbi:MAG TPA: hypothetical protein PKI14_04400 [Fervidobacterium sp.]|nr:hypothetical protein [Fervidobacterium sp.]